ncbi:hypothetical protein B0J18DRAFT_439149 [Chaetomium sp. MPI-SDFR-AT-0129]|nr:hypothetical protein B0J18DRAFT_439149 [Chaetomium sp. MPI-SDFR-AT-0129]
MMIYDDLMRAAGFHKRILRQIMLLSYSCISNQDTPSVAVIPCFIPVWMCDLIFLCALIALTVLIPQPWPAGLIHLLRLLFFYILVSKKASSEQAKACVHYFGDGRWEGNA